MEPDQTDSRRRPLRFTHVVTLCAAVCFISQLAFAVFGIPHRLTSWIRCDNTPKQDNPGWIVILGGSGVPSPATLMRTYYGAHCAQTHRRAECVVALPAGGVALECGTGRMREELILRGVSANRIKMEHRGYNTHEQAQNVARMVGPSGRRGQIILVTSPYHMRRAYLCFRKAGFENVGVLAAHSTGSQEDYRKAVESWSGFNRGSLAGNFRYAFWSNLVAEVWISRELLGLAFYQLRGWI